MELREFAEQVLFAASIEEKLASPRDITDDAPGAAISAPAAPGRPAHLTFKTSGEARSSFPKLRELESENERGRLLHFFANHELLATELMALALLRFPDAPKAFRRGVLLTLREEQEHTRLYIERMRQCGVSFGEIPVSGYFWRSVSPMESPMDYVAGLSLTFEQANLDFARQFAEGFATVGDADSATLLRRIYTDEIAHVAYGLHWFRRWKDAGLSDWDAFCRQLKFPLSPQRAKGPGFNAEGRRLAGLDESFISELAVYSRSKGRTPSVFVFNLFAEGFIAQGRAFSPNKHLAQIAADLGNLPQFLCRQDDIVLVSERPSKPFLEELRNAGFPLPEFVELGAQESGSKTPPEAIQRLAVRKLGRLRPWAWSPDSLELLAPLFGSLTGETRAPDSAFNQKIAPLYSKAWSADFLREWMATTAGEWDDDEIASEADGDERRGFCALDEVGEPVTNADEAMRAIDRIRARGHHRIVVKEAIGLAGGNALRLWEPGLLEGQKHWMANAFLAGRTLVVEPWLEREHDFSIQLEMGAEGLKICGHTGLVNDLKGQFIANFAGPDSARRFPAAVLKSLRGWRDPAKRLHRIYESIRGRLEIKLRTVGYTGPVGIDAFVHRARDGQARLKPVVEINPRYTMGRLTLELMRRCAPGGHGEFRLINRAALRDQGFSDFQTFLDALREQRPLQFEGAPIPKIQEGVVCLNDPERAQACLAIFTISRTPAWEGPRQGLRES
ncbi:MAG: DUF455 family protein [Verrucomicrobia bacterium]|nr:DUF455 family protein [Verrucomicrobiota bacterium]MBI3867656.1 DUF455 family protein [Verrucomicrobiota bacterium]